MANQTMKSIENIIKIQLKSFGYFTVLVENDSDNETSFNVVAEGGRRNIFLKVLIRLVSEHLHELTMEEINTIKHTATIKQKEPWAAILSVNSEGQLIDSIEWKNLSRQLD